MNLNTIHHIAVICSDYERSKKFYTEVLGFKILNETHRAERESYKLDLSVNENTQIELFSFPHPPTRLTHPEAAGLRHLAFSVKDFDNTLEELKNRGVIVENVRIDENTGKKYTFFFDPDNLPIEIYEA